MLMRLQTIIVYCSDMQRSLAFYGDKLGFPVKRQYADRTEFHCGPVTLALYLGTEDNTAANSGQSGRGDTMVRPGRAQFSFEVLSLDAFYKDKKEKGVEFALPPTPQDFGMILAVMLDPDGLPISVVQHVG
jgi:catechol 2,3-dioxygenase-like lactoylglutathione lyase family enzyme